jgi:hypothetical protein
MEDWMYLIKDLGFPIVMVIYFMTINNKTIKRNTDALVALEKAILIKEGRRQSL